MKEAISTEWSLDEFYKGYDDPAYKKDLADMDKVIDDLDTSLEQAKQMNAKEALLCLVKAQEDFLSHSMRLGIYTSLRQSANTTDSQTNAYMAQIMKKEAKATKSLVAIQKYMADIPNLEEVIASDEKLKEYQFLLLKNKKHVAHLFSEDMEAMIAKMNLSGGAAWNQLFEYLTSTVKVDYNGTQITLPSVRNLAYDSDSAVKKAAYEAELNCYEKIDHSIAFALNNIKSQVNMLCEARGYESPLDMTLEDSNMSRKTLDAMLEAMREYMPKFHEYMKAKARFLGHKNGLPWYDLFAPVGALDKKYSIEEAQEYLVQTFRAFSDDMADMMDTAFNDHWIDFMPREGKVGGAFCCNVGFLKQSRILTNYDYTFGSIDTLAHELGHAYHGMMIENNRILNQEYPMPLAETASTFNETHITKLAISKTEGLEKLALLESLLMNTTQITCDIYSRYLFESRVFEECKDRLLMPEDLKEIMIEAQKEAYGDGLDPDYMHPYMWACKGHYYSENLSFYNFPYAFGGLFAMGLYTQFEKEGADFVPKYRNLLKATTDHTIEEVAAMADIDVTDKTFWEESLKAFADLVDEFVALSDSMIK